MPTSSLDRVYTTRAQHKSLGTWLNQLLATSGQRDHEALAVNTSAELQSASAL